MSERKTPHTTASPAHNRATAKYNAANTIQLQLRLNTGTDADVIAHLETLEESKRGYILRLIREDMARNQ